MRLVLFVAGIFLLSACGGTGSNENFGESTTIETKAVYEFGNVKQGEIVKAKFLIKNTGEIPLKIVRVEPSCGCTVADFTKEPILPGKTGWVKAQVNTDHFEGEIHKSVNMLANTLPTTTTLIVRGTVLK